MRVQSFLNASYTRIDGPYTSKENTSASEKSTYSTSSELTSSEKAIITRLQATDIKVKAHERAHLSSNIQIISYSHKTRRR